MRKYLFISSELIIELLIRKVFEYSQNETIFNVEDIKKSAQDFYNRNFHFLDAGEKLDLLNKIEKFSPYNFENYKKYNDNDRTSMIMVLTIFKPYVARQLAVGTGNKRYIDYTPFKITTAKLSLFLGRTIKNPMDITPHTPTHPLYDSYDV